MKLQNNQNLLLLSGAGKLVCNLFVERNFL